MAVIPVDVNGYEHLMFFKAEQAIDYESKDPAVDDNGDPVYILSFAVSAQGRWRLENEVIDVKVSYPKSRNPMSDLYGKQVKFEGLVATPSLGGQTNKYLRVNYQADSVAPVNTTARPEAKASA